MGRDCPPFEHPPPNTSAVHAADPWAAQKEKLKPESEAFKLGFDHIRGSPQVTVAKGLSPRSSSRLFLSTPQLARHGAPNASNALAAVVFSP